MPKPTFQPPYTPLHLFIYFPLNTICMAYICFIVFFILLISFSSFKAGEFLEKEEKERKLGERVLRSGALHPVFSCYVPRHRQVCSCVDPRYNSKQALYCSCTVITVLYLFVIYICVMSVYDIFVFVRLHWSIVKRNKRSACIVRFLFRKHVCIILKNLLACDSCYP